jgi:hypothetical protein
MNFLRICLLFPLLISVIFAEDAPANATQAAEQVILPKVDFRETELREAVDFLIHVGWKYAKQPTRLNVILAVPPGPRPKITLQRQNESLLASLKEVAAQAGCEVQGEAHALVVCAKGAPPFPPIKAGADVQAIRTKIDRIVLPRIDFRETRLSDTVEFLVRKMKQLDPEGGGVSLVLKTDDQGGRAENSPPNVPGIPGLPANGAPSTGRATAAAKVPGSPVVPADAPAAPLFRNDEKRISLQVTNMPILELLRYIAGLADLQVSIEKFSILIAPPAKK